MDLGTILDPEKFMAAPVEQRRRLVLDFIKENPEKHDQGVYGRTAGGKFSRPTPELSCGTTACVAGWATVFAGYTPIVRYDGYDGWQFVDVVPPGGGILSVHYAARDILGLTPEEADMLFGGSNSREDIETMLENLERGVAIEADTSQDGCGDPDCPECY